MSKQQNEKVYTLSTPFQIPPRTLHFHQPSKIDNKFLMIEPLQHMHDITQRSFDPTLSFGEGRGEVYTFINPLKKFDDRTAAVQPMMARPFFSSLKMIKPGPNQKFQPQSASQHTPMHKVPQPNP